MKKIILLFLLCISVSINAQTTLGKGEIAFIGLYMDGLSTSGDGFTFILLRDLEAGTVIYFTDEGWDASHTTWYGNSNDAHFTWTVPTGGLNVGTIVHIENTTTTTYSATSGTVSATLSGIWNLSSSGDQILTYQSSSGVRPASPSFITAADADYYIGSTYDGPDGWGASYYNQSYCSDLPVGLTNGVDCLALVNANTAVQGGYAVGYECDNYKYTGTLKGTAAAIRTAINTNTNWTGNENGSLDIGVAAYSTPEITDPLPVELTMFTAIRNTNNVELTWQTVTEVNNYGFEIERASSTTSPVQGGQGNEWIVIGFVQGHGNSNSPKEYSFVDTNPPAGNLFYRLKQIDNDGQYEYYGQVAELNFSVSSASDEQIPTKFALDQNYPNPFNPSTKIRYSIPILENVSIKIYDVLGNVIKTIVEGYKNAGTYEIVFDAGNLTSGLYFYKIHVGSFVEIKKMILIR